MSEFDKIYEATVFLSVADLRPLYFIVEVYTCKNI